MSFLLKSLLFISVCVAALTAQTFWIFSSKSDLAITPILINFIGTFCVYNIQKLFDSTKDEFQQFEKYKWYNNYKKLLLTIIFLFVFTSAPTIYSFLIHNTTYLWLYLLSFISVFVYYFKPLRLRSIGWYKPIHIALMYVFYCIVIPLKAHLNEETFIYLISQFILIYCLCLIYDFKDIYQDKVINLKTIATQLNLKKFKIACVSLLLLYLLLLLFTQNLSLIYSSVGVGIYLTFLVLFLNNNLKYNFYLLFVDGVLILQLLLIILFSNND